MVKQKRTMIGVYIVLAAVLTLVIIFIKPDIYTSICLVLIAALLIFVLSDDFKSLRESNELASNAIVTLVATLVGVYLAVSIANSESAKAEQNRKTDEAQAEQKRKDDEAKSLLDKRIAILKAIENDFYLSRQGLEDYDRGYLSIQYKETVGVPLKAKDSKIVSEPDLFGEYLKQDLILIVIYPKIINDFLSLYRNASNSYKEINKNELKTIEDFRLQKELAIMYTQMFVWFIDLQISIMQGQVTDEQIKARQLEIRRWSNSFIIELQMKYPNKFGGIKIPPPDSKSIPKR